MRHSGFTLGLLAVGITVGGGAFAQSPASPVDELPLELRLVCTGERADNVDVQSTTITGDVDATVKTARPVLRTVKAQVEIRGGGGQVIFDDVGRREFSNVKATPGKITASYVRRAFMSNTTFDVLIDRFTGRMTVTSKFGTGFAGDCERFTTAKF